MKKKKVLVLASTFPRWENDTTPPFIFELERRLTKNFEIHVLAPHFKGAKDSEVLENVKVTRFHYFWPDSLQRLCYEGGILPNIKKNKLLIFQTLPLIFFELIASLKIIRAEKIDMVHAHWIIPQGIIAILIRKFTGVPYIITTHGGDIYGLRNKLLEKVKILILNNADGISVVSENIKNRIKQLNSSLDVSVISMGVDSKLFNPSKFSEQIKKKFNVRGEMLLFVGRLAEKKGVEYLIRAIPKVIRKFPNVKLLIVGDGALKTQLVSLVSDLKIEKQVIFVGSIMNEELPKYYATADVFIGPSIEAKGGDTEGLGLTFVEAVFSGCVPIGTDVGGISDVIEDKETGFVVRQKNSDEIAKVIQYVLNNRVATKKMVKSARPKLIEKFDWFFVKKRYADLYEKIS